jgi:hypothetical protein
MRNTTPRTKQPVPALGEPKQSPRRHATPAADENHRPMKAATKQTAAISTSMDSPFESPPATRRAQPYPDSDQEMVSATPTALANPPCLQAGELAGTAALR